MNRANASTSACFFKAQDEAFVLERLKTLETLAARREEAETLVHKSPLNRLPVSSAPQALFSENGRRRGVRNLRARNLRTSGSRVCRAAARGHRRSELSARRKPADGEDFGQHRRGVFFLGQKHSGRNPQGRRRGHVSLQKTGRTRFSSAEKISLEAPERR
jgi:hypothetical protein